jgi:hypothetical protein
MSNTKIVPAATTHDFPPELETLHRFGRPLSEWIYDLRNAMRDAGEPDGFADCDEAMTICQEMERFLMETPGSEENAKLEEKIDEIEEELTSEREDRQEARKHLETWAVCIGDKLAEAVGLSHVYVDPEDPGAFTSKVLPVVLESVEAAARVQAAISSLKDLPVPVPAPASPASGEDTSK